MTVPGKLLASRIAPRKLQSLGATVQAVLVASSAVVSTSRAAKNGAGALDNPGCAERHAAFEREFDLKASVELDSTVVPSLEMTNKPVRARIVNNEARAAGMGVKRFIGPL